jgi:hypothetical protein
MRFRVIVLQEKVKAIVMVMQVRIWVRLIVLQLRVWVRATAMIIVIKVLIGSY